MNWDDNNTYFFYFHHGDDTLKSLKEYVDGLIKIHGENAKIELQGDYDGMVHYSNLQPLWAIDNIRKGNKYEPTN